MSAQRADTGLIGRLGGGCHRHRWATVAVWVVAVAFLITFWQQFGAAADDSFAGADPGQTVLNEHFARSSGDTLTLAIRSAAPVTSPGVRARVGTALVPFRQAPDVTAVPDPYVTPGHVSSDRHIAYASVQFGVPSASISGGEVKTLMHDATAASGHGVTFSLGGDVVDTQETPYGGSSDGIGVAAAAAVLLIAFGSLLAMGLPVATALMGIGSGLSLIALIGHLFPAPSFSPIIAAMIGLGVGVDYALFIVTRFRAELRAGQDPAAAVVTSMRTAGTSVLTAGTTVVIGMLGLLILRQPLLNGVAVAASATVAMTVLAALTLLPALLGFTGVRLARPSRLGARLRRRRPQAEHPGARAERRDPWPSAQHGGVAAGGGPGPAAEGGVPAADGNGARHPAQRWAEVIQRHPVKAVVASAVFIAVLAAPALAMKLSLPDESTQARNTMGYASYAAMAQGFGPGFDAPLIVTATLPAPGRTTGLAALRTDVEQTKGVASATPPVISKDGRAAMIVAYPTTGEQDAATSTLVNTLNGTVLPKATQGTGLTAYVTGPNAANVAFANLINQRLPLLIGVVVALSMALLLVVFRSVVVAVKAAAMNLLSIGAAYGVLTAITQWGWGGRLLGFPEKMPVTTWVPIFLFVILFGLSMDYEVFLLSRIREEYDLSGDNSGAVARGLALTARVISAAAAIMVVVFLSFVLTPEVSVKQIGLGLAAAVLIDATVVRLVLVPAVMELLGKANWWLPTWLARLLPRPDSTGPNRTGPGSPGPDSTGPGSTGPDSTGPGSTGPDSTGPDSTGFLRGGEPCAEVPTEARADRPAQAR